jgi:redox-regulated HSP33 family molecular chaperone
MAKKANSQTIQTPETITFICEWCGKFNDFTKEKVEKLKKTDTQITQVGFDYYISCPFCDGGYMFSQEDLAFRDLATDLFGD